LFLWGALSDERTGLSFVYAAGPRQRSLSLVRVPRDSWSYFTVSDMRLPFSSLPTTRRVTVQVFDPASIRVNSPYLATSLYRLRTNYTEHRAPLLLCDVTEYAQAAWTQSRHLSSIVVWRHRLGGSVFTDPFHRSGLHNPTLLSRVCIT
jgi:hypothetical protein